MLWTFVYVCPDPAIALLCYHCVYWYGDSSIVLGRLMRLVTRSGNRVSGRIRRKENQLYVPPSHILHFFITINNSMYVKQTTKVNKN